MVYAVIDTNIIVSSFITKNPSSATRRVINSMLSGKIKPLYNDEILAEYFDVLSRSKFHLNEVRINELLYFIKQNGIDSSRFPYDGEMPDEDDRVFYEVCLSKEDYRQPQAFSKRTAGNYSSRNDGNPRHRTIRCHYSRCLQIS
ncbi:PIN domain-containing protein [Segatella copri]|uniref:PIN domain-containing protein n=1 Tax=Segatella copri TaxID=165179 RepID=UPI003460CDD9